MGNCMERNKKISPNDFDDIGRIESVHTITKLSDLKLDFVDNTPDSYTVKVVDTLKRRRECIKLILIIVLLILINYDYA